MENIERPEKVTKAQRQEMTPKNQQKYDNDQFTNIYNYLDKLNVEASDKTNVTVTQTQTSGTELAAINVNGTETKIYAPTVNIDIQMVAHTFSQQVGSAGTTKQVTQNISKSGYKPVGIVGTENITVGFVIVDYRLYLSASNNGSGTIAATIKNDANGGTQTFSMKVYVLWVKV